VRRRLLRHATGGRAADGARPTVFFLLSSAWGMGGTIRTVHHIAGHLARRHEVEILTAYRRREKPYFPFGAGVRVTALDDQRPGAVPLLRRPLRRLLAARASVLVDHRDLLSETFSMWTDIQIARRLRGRRGVLIGTRPGLNVLAARLGTDRLVPVGTEHMHLEHHRSTLREVMADDYSRLAALVVLTERDREQYRAAFGGRPEVRCIPNSVADIGPPFADLDATTVLAAGRLHPQKGFDLLIEAFATVAASHPGWSLCIRGRGPDLEALRRQVGDAGLEGRVRLPGPTDDMPGAMAQASIFVLSSRWEGFPLVLIEAMSKGMACVAFDCDTGPAELIDDRRNGLLVEAGDVAGLAAAVGELIADPALRRRCGAAALETARAYTVAEVGRRWEDLLEGLVPSSPS
jgi:glycosyltransferase involved in cell wall biosynthesis